MAHLSILVAEFGEDIPYAGGLARGFPFHGTRVPFLNYQKGIYRAAVQTGPAALSIQTSSKSPYDDEILADGFLYAYRSGAIDQPDNRALRAAHGLQVPLVYFIGTRPGWYKPVFPCYVREDDPSRRMVLVTPGALRGPSTSLRPCRSRIRSSAVTRSVKRGSGSIRLASEAGSFPHIAASARSVG
jgi:putative restriction endonuclease